MARRKMEMGEQDEGRRLRLEDLPVYLIVRQRQPVLEVDGVELAISQEDTLRFLFGTKAVKRGRQEPTASAETPRAPDVVHVQPKAKGPTIRQRILSALEVPMTSRELRELLGANETSLNSELWRMKALGLLARDDRGVYSLVQAAPALPPAPAQRESRWAKEDFTPPEPAREGGPEVHRKKAWLTEGLYAALTDTPQSLEALASKLSQQYGPITSLNSVEQALYRMCMAETAKRSPPNLYSRGPVAFQTLEELYAEKNAKGLCKYRTCERKKLANLTICKKHHDEQLARGNHAKGKGHETT